ncbi:SH3 domain protein [Cooperia oncophora]
MDTPVLGGSLVTTSIQYPQNGKAAETGNQNTATALFDYVAGQSDELSFRAGDVIVIVEKKDADWWAGHKVDTPNVRGLFPANYVQLR